MIMLRDYLHAMIHSRRNSKTNWALSAYKVILSRMRHGIGPRYFMLFQLYDQPTDAWPDYILDTESNPKLRTINARGFWLARDKLAFARHCILNEIKTIPIICFIDHSQLAAPPGIAKANDVEEWVEIMAGSPDVIFIKTIDGAHGSDAFKASRVDQETWNVHGQLYSSRNLYRELNAKVKNKRGWIVQPSIRSHNALTDLMPGDTLGTIRAVTYLTPDGPALVLPVIRLPARGNQTDNFSEGSTGNIVAAIDEWSGTLSGGFTSRDISRPNIDRVTCHPDTGAQIEGARIPYWVELRELILSAHRKTPILKTVGWDVGVTEDGPIIVEANGGYDSSLLQVAHQRGLRNEFDRIFRECAKKDRTGGDE